MFVSIRCGICRHESDLDNFTRTPVSGTLPKGRYQCPACGTAWKIERTGVAQTFASGLVIPAGRRVAQAGAVL